MLIEKNKIEDENSHGQQDLFSVEPPPEPEHEEIVMPSVTEENGEKTDSPSSENAPLVTNSVVPEKRPLVFSDGNPMPSRDGAAAVPSLEKRDKSLLSKRRRIHLSAESFTSADGFGSLLTEARRQAGMTKEQVLQITKLSSHYFEALEHSDLDHLPPSVYVLAYVRTLGELYALDDESMTMLLDRLHAGPGASDVPSTLIQTLEKDSLVNEAEAKRINKFFWAAVIILIVLLSGVVWIICALVHASSSGTEQTEEKSSAAAAPATMEEPAGKPVFSREDFDALRVPQMPEASTLQMSRKRSIVQ